MLSVVIVGRPNVGKSTLFNRIVGRRKALVHDQPGVTRDRLVEDVVHEGRRFRLVDTGGILGGSRDPIHDLVGEQVDVAIEEGDRILFLVDGAEGLLPVEHDLAARLRKAGKEVTLVVNKVDAPSHAFRETEFHALGIPRVFPVSAEHGLGVQELLDHLLRDVAPSPPEPSRIAFCTQPRVWSSRIWTAAASSADRMADTCVRMSMQ